MSEQLHCLCQRLQTKPSFADKGIPKYNLGTREKRFNLTFTMTNDIRKLIAAEPFVQFTIHTADGNSLQVPTVDHVAISQAGGRIIVFGDNDDYNVLSPLLVARISIDSGASHSSPSA